VSFDTHVPCGVPFYSCHICYVMEQNLSNVIVNKRPHFGLVGVITVTCTVQKSCLPYPRYAFTTVLPRQLMVNCIIAAVTWSFMFTNHHCFTFYLTHFTLHILPYTLCNSAFYPQPDKTCGTHCMIVEMSFFSKVGVIFHSVGSQALETKKLQGQNNPVESNPKLLAVISLQVTLCTIHTTATHNP